MALESETLKEGVHRYTRFVAGGPPDTTLVFAYESRARAKRKWIACKPKYFEAQQTRYKSVNSRTYEPLLLKVNHQADLWGPNGWEEWLQRLKLSLGMGFGKFGEVLT